MGQKQTFTLHQLMSALPPKADITNRLDLPLRAGAKIQPSAIGKCDVAYFFATCDRRNFQCLVGKFVTEVLKVGLVECAITFHSIPHFVASKPLGGNTNRPSHFHEESSAVV